MRCDDLTTAQIIEMERPYLAANGHAMIRPVLSTPKGNVIHSSVNAHCVDDCSACARNEPLPTW